METKKVTKIEGNHYIFFMIFFIFLNTGLSEASLLVKAFTKGV